MKVILFILIAVVVIGADALILLRTATKPKIPESAKPAACENEDLDR